MSVAFWLQCWLLVESARPRMAVTPARCKLTPVRTRLLPGTAQPCWALVDAAVGRCFFWEARQWQAGVGVENPVDFRKQERRRGILARVSISFDLEVMDLPASDRSGAGFGTQAMSTRALLAWLLERRAMCGHSKGLAQAQRWTWPPGAHSGEWRPRPIVPRLAPPWMETMPPASAALGWAMGQGRPGLKYRYCSLAFWRRERSNLRTVGYARRATIFNVGCGV